MANFKTNITFKEVEMEVENEFYPEQKEIRYDSNHTGSDYQPEEFIIESVKIGGVECITLFDEDDLDKIEDILRTRED